MPEKGQRLAFWLCLRLDGFSGWGLFCLSRKFCNLFILGKQLQLLHALGFGPETMPVRPVQLVLKLFNFQGQRLYFCRQKLTHLPQFGGVFR